MRLRIKIVLMREVSAASIQLEFHFLTQHNISTGELFEFVQPALRDDNTGLRAEAIDVLIDIKTDSYEEVADMDYSLPSPDGRYFDPVAMYERVFALLAKDSRFDWEV